ncbi:helix-turn-helix domain-containing protein [Streptomyces alanosinicus]|uniref:HTH lysR-type domain-containing protein n=1 Tax=Streptomyces alanosinicus TaxID=68171 RepID=A0A918YNB3_9ACTN|nr:LysR family transcriptional regulator [Streptomyces alanosinicus]GHE09650.1 hypothetical protein GCM10010339_62720 [Streptomyces alanosinicus]
MVHRLASFTAAARRLGLPQSPVTVQIRALGNRMGRELFERGGRGVTPLPHADELATRLANPLDQLAGVTGEAPGHTVAPVQPGRARRVPERRGPQGTGPAGPADQHRLPRPTPTSWPVSALVWTDFYARLGFTLCRDGIGIPTPTGVICHGPIRGFRFSVRPLRTAV